MLPRQSFHTSYTKTHLVTHTNRIFVLFAIRRIPVATAGRSPVASHRDASLRFRRDGIA